MRFEHFVARRFFRVRTRAHFISTVALFAMGGIAVGVAALVIVLSVMNGLESEVRSRIIGITSHINVYSFKPEMLEDWSSIINRIDSIPKVVSSAPFVQGNAAISGAGGEDGIMLRGILPELEQDVTRFDKNIISGEFYLPNPDSSETEAIVLGKYLADKLGVIPGDTVRLYTLKSNSKLTSIFHRPRVRKFLVTGVFETGMYDFDAALALVHLKSAQNIYGMGRTITGIEVRITNFNQAKKMAKELSGKLGYLFYATSWIDMNKNLFAWITIEKWGMFLILSLIVLVAAFNIISTLIMVAMEKTEEIGILKAIGATKKSIHRIFVYQGLRVGITGTAAGVIIGLVVCLLQMRYHIISLPPEVYSISALPVDMRLPDFIAISAGSILLSLLSTIYPATRAASLMPLDTIRHRE